MKNVASKVFCAKEDAFESDEGGEEAISLKRKSKTNRRAFQFAKDSRNEERELKKKKLVEGVEGKLEKLCDKQWCELVILSLNFFFWCFKFLFTDI